MSACVCVACVRKERRKIYRGRAAAAALRCKCFFR